MDMMDLDKPKAVSNEFKMFWGKYKGETIDYIRNTNENYLFWVISQENSTTDPRYADKNRQLISALEKNVKEKPWIITFGKYKGKPLMDVYNEDFKYFKYLSEKNSAWKKLILWSL